MSAGDSTAVREDQFAKRGAEWQFIIARLFNIAGEAEDFCAGALLGSKSSIPFRAALNDQRHTGKRLNIVHDSGFAIQTESWREWRPQPGLPQLAFERFKHGGFFAAYVRAGA